MAPKKKKKQSKLTRMTDEEKALYLQKKMAAEEEARQRKNQLIETFMKIKLKREEAFARLNLAKINQQWRQILRQAKCKDLKQDMEAMRTAFERTLTAKNALIKHLQVDLEEAEEQYMRLLQSHFETIDKMMALQNEYLEELCDNYKKELATLKEEDIREVKYIIKNQENDKLHISTAIFVQGKQQQSMMDDLNNHHAEALGHAIAKHTADDDDLEFLNRHRMLFLLKKFQAVLSDYLGSTEQKRKSYAVLRGRDTESTTEIYELMTKMDKLADNIEEAKEKLASLDENDRLHELRKDRSEVATKFEFTRKKLKKYKCMSEKTITNLTVQSNKTLQELERLKKKGEYILRKADLCHRLETEEEKVMPFYAESVNPGELTELSAEQARFLVDFCEERGLVLYSDKKEYRALSNLDTFWKRYNKVFLDRAMLQVEHENLSVENKQLCNALRLYLSEITPSMDNEDDENSILIIRPRTTVGRKKKTSIDLRPMVNEPRVISHFSPVPCIEGCIAARHIVQ